MYNNGRTKKILLIKINTIMKYILLLSYLPMQKESMVVSFNRLGDKELSTTILNIINITKMLSTQKIRT